VGRLVACAAESSYHPEFLVPVGLEVQGVDEGQPGIGAQCVLRHEVLDQAVRVHLGELVHVLTGVLACMVVGEVRGEQPRVEPSAQVLEELLLDVEILLDPRRVRE
jgi:hypothetical protein